MAISGNTINNSGTGTIAARDTLLIGAQTLNNTNGGLIYSLGDITIGGAIVGGQVQGTMQTLTNASSRIEAGGDLKIAANTVTNRNDRLTTAEVVVGTGYEEKVRVKNTGNEYPVKDRCKGIGGDQDDNECIVYPDKYGKRSTLPQAFSTVCKGGGDDGQVCTSTPNYDWNSPVFTKFQVATVGTPPPEPPAGGCTQYSGDNGPSEILSPGCIQWHADMDAWIVANNARLSELDTKITAYNAEVNHDNLVESFEDYTWFKINSTTTRTQVVSTAPGELLSGLSMTTTGKAINQDSRVVAGGKLVATLGVDNLATQGLEKTEYSGTRQFTEVNPCHGIDHCRDWDPPQIYEQSPDKVKFSLPTVEYVAYAANPTVTRNLVVGRAAADQSVAATALQATGNTHPSINPAPIDVTVPVLTVPQNSLFQLQAAPSARHLVETDPRFTSQRDFLSSDYYLQALNRDPERSLKRYGDGFVEQKLVNDQILALTGRRYLSGYASTEDEYRALMDAGVAYARQYQLTPGVALTAEQMAQLSTDMVLLVAQTVTLPDGSTQQVLVPQVYLRRPAAGDVRPGGALIAATDVVIRSPGDIVNSGTIAGDRVAILADRDLTNTSGRIAGQDVLLRANNNLKNLSGTIEGVGAGSKVRLSAGRDIVLQTQTLSSVSKDGTSTGTTLQRTATVQGGSVSMAAGRDLLASGSVVKSDGDLLVSAKRHLVADTATAESQLHSKESTGRTVQGRSGYIDEASTRHQGSVFESGGNAVLVADGDARLTGTQVKSADVTVQAQNITINAAVNRTASDMQVIGEKSYNRFARDNETLVGTDIQAGNNLTLRATGNSQAGSGNLSITGSNLNTEQGRAALIAANDVTINAAATRQAAVDERYTKSSGLFSSTATTRATSTTLNQAQGSAVSGNTVVVQAGRDIKVAGSGIAGEGDVNIVAGGNVDITTATNTSERTSVFDEKKSGLFGSGGASLTLGQRQLNQQSEDKAITQSGSAIVSLSGNVMVDAGKTYTQTGSQVLAEKGDIDIAARRIVINAAENNNAARQESRFSQSGLTVSVSTPVLDAAQSVGQVADAAGKTSSGRTKAAAVAAAAAAGYNAYDAVQRGQGSAIDGRDNQLLTGQTNADGTPQTRDATAADKLGGINVSIAYSSASSNSQATQNSRTAVGSTIAAGGNVRLAVTGDGKESILTITGSTISAGNKAVLEADNIINLLAAQNIADERSSNSSRSGSLGVSMGTQGGIGITSSVSRARGNAAGSDVTQVNTHVQAGNQVILKSGGDADLTGAVVAGKKVTADIGGNLKLESLQDTSRYSSRQNSIGGSLTVGTAGAGGSLNLSDRKVDSDYASVREQTGIIAGEDGYDIHVKGNATLTGAVIAASDQALAEGKGKFKAEGKVTQIDIVNQAQYDASGTSIGIGGGISGAAGFKPGVSVGMGSDSNSQTTVTKAGIGVSTGMNTTAAIKPIFDAKRVEGEVDAQVTITQTLSREGPKVVGTYAESKLREANDKRQQAASEASTAKQASLRAEAEQLENDWKEGGKARIALHTASGALGGGAAGAIGAGSSAALVPVIAEDINKLDVPTTVKRGLIAVTGTAVGAALGGQIGAASGLTQTTNNFLLHQEASKREEAKQKLLQCKDDNCRQQVSKEVDEWNKLDTWRDEQIKAACTTPSSPACQSWNAAIQYAKASYAGYDAKSDVTGSVAGERREVNEMAYLYGQRADNPYLFGIGKGLLKLTPPGMVVGVGVGSYSLTKTIMEKGLVDSAIGIAKGIENLPSDIKARLSSDDPTVRGEALVDALSIGGGAAIVSAKLVQVGGERLAQSVAKQAAIKAEADALKKGQVELQATTQLPEADYAGQIPVRPRDGAVKPGTPVTEAPLAKHLIEAEIIGSGKSKVISGGHNMDNFDALVKRTGAQILKRDELAPGIYQVEYQLPGGKVQPKTVYDPAVYSDAKMADMASEAASRAIVQWGINKNPIQNVEVGGVTFRVPISIKSGNASIPTAFPIDPKRVTE
ncbi:hemagglutinin repeat-containing protein [Noviherbaspirillum humi]|uniref:hemagglutinin repeat-containing protein n=1 Tax=Noviherbaspirillum humi TaxID=1688639 RepID=UPI001C3DEE78|nr:hemagglutinin repeat-containing protein [Noviherbaspirillum humi]